MNPKLQEVMDLTSHLYNRISSLCMQTTSLTTDSGFAISIPISACLMLVCDILEAGTKAGIPPATIQTLRQEISDRILGKSSGSVSIGIDGSRPLGEE